MPFNRILTKCRGGSPDGSRENLRPSRRAGRDNRTALQNKLHKKSQTLLFGFWSGWQDSNLRPPAPKAGAITELRYTP